MSSCTRENQTRLRRLLWRILTHMPSVCNLEGMANRHTMNVSLPRDMERFVRAQVETGRYRTASEVVRDGLRLLEEAEGARLLEKALSESLSADEEGLIAPELLARARDHIRQLVAEGLRDRDAGRVSDGPAAMQRVGQRLRARSAAP